jgi:hypothetical protein
MKLEIPFYKQESDTDCGIVALKMVLNYFKEIVDNKTLEELIEKKENKGILTIQIAVAAATLGFKTEFFSKEVNFNEENLKQDFYKKYSDENLLEKSKELLKRAREKGVRVYEKTLDLEEILKVMDNRSVVIVLVDWNVVKGKEGYQGHFVPLVGYKDDCVIIHDPGKDNPQPFLKLSKELFDKARKSKGTDEDIIIIYRK